MAVDLYRTLQEPVPFTPERRHHPWRAFGKLVGASIIVIGSLYAANSARSEAAQDRAYVPTQTAQEAQDFGIPQENRPDEASTMDKIADEADLLPVELAIVALATAAYNRRRLV